MVFFEHYLAFFFPKWNWGWAGVDIFFVLSGFLITGILYDSRNAANRFRVFYMRRTLRIFPLYYAVLLLALVTTPFMHWVWNPAWILWALYLGNYARFLFYHSPLMPLGAIEHLVSRPHHILGLTFYLGHFWSLCVEEQFYLVWPLVVFTIRRRSILRAICLCSLPLALAARVACLFVLPHWAIAAEFLYRVTPLRVDALLLGGLAALCLRGPEAATLLRLARPLLYSLCAAFLLFELTYAHLSPTHTVFVPAAGARLLTTIGYTVIDLFAVALILNLLSTSHLLARLFLLKPLRALGRISYGFYVFHDIFHAFFLQVVTNHSAAGTSKLQLGLRTAAVALVVTIALAYLSFRYFEAPFLRLKSRFQTAS